MAAASKLPLKVVSRVPLSGPAVRFDYQSFDGTTGRLWISHMDANELLAYDTRLRKIVETIRRPVFTG